MTTKEQKRKHALYVASWRKKNPQSYIAAYKKYSLNPKNREKILNSQLKYRQSLREKILNHYGNVCVCCGEKEQSFLCIDHINSDGNKHRKSINIYSGFHFAIWVVKNNFPNFLQLLCYNCNMAKSHYGLCPHKK